MLFFLDIETTGLCEKQDCMLEIACAAFDGTKVLDCVETTIRPDEVFWRDRMDAYVTDMHTKNGLLEELDNSTPRDVHKAESLIMTFIDAFKDQWGVEMPIIAGNSIQFDRRFIHEKMPDLDSMLSHRMFDCSTLKMFAGANWPELIQDRTVEPAHRALADVMESIQTYKHYVERFNPRAFAAKARRS